MKKSLIKILFICPMLSAPLALGNYVPNNNTLQKTNHEAYAFHGGTAHDRYYTLFFDAGTAKKLLTYSGTNWWSYLDDGDWSFGNDFHFNLRGNGGFGWNDEGSIHDLVQNENAFLFTGIAPDGYKYGKFDNTSFVADLHTAVKTNHLTALWFYCYYAGPFDDNLYGAHWSTWPNG